MRMLRVVVLSSLVAALTGCGTHSLNLGSRKGTMSCSCSGTGCGCSHCTGESVDCHCMAKDAYGGHSNVGESGE